METYVIGWFSSTKVVVVHGGQIVVNEGHGVDHFQGDGRGHGDLLGSAKHFAGGQAEDGSDALASGH